MVNLETKAIGIMRDKKAPLHFRALGDKLPLKRGRKMVICFAGNACKTQKAANGMAKIAENVCAKEGRNCDFAAFYYTNLSEKKDRTTIFAQAHKIGKDFYQTYLKDLIATTDENGKLKRLSFNQAAENMNKLMFFNHCFGSYIMESIEEVMVKDMTELLYSEMEQKMILRQCLVINNNNVSEHLGQKEPYMSYVERISGGDKKRLKINYAPDSVQKFVAQELMTDDEVLLVKLKDNQALLLAHRLTKEGGDEHNGGQWEENKSEAGKIEESIAKAMIGEFLNRKKPLIGIVQLALDAKKHLYMSAKAADKLDEIIEYGDEYAADYEEFRQKQRLMLKKAALVR